MTTRKVTDESFDSEVLASEKPVLVDFWAEWCGPCKQIGPALEELAAERSDLDIAKLNIDENPDIPVRFGIRSIPTLILFKNGEPLAIKQGAAPKAMLSSWLDQTLGSSDSDSAIVG